MKHKLLGLILALGLTTGLSAQSKMGIKGGLNLASEYIRVGNQSSSTKIAPRYHLSVYYDAAILPKFSVQPGISLEGKGGVSEIDGESVTDKFLYLQVPVNFIMRLPTASGDFFIGAGPYLAYGIDAKLTSGRDAIHLTWGSGPQELNPFDAGLNFLLGYRFHKGITLNLASSVGMMNMSNQGTGKYLNRVSSFGIGYEFSVHNN